MKATISRCDICGADDTAGNRVCVQVTRTNPNQPTRNENPFSLFSSMYEVKVSESLDLCQHCGGGLLDILKQRQRVNAAAKRNAPKPANPTVGLVTLEQFYSALEKKPEK